MWIYKPYSVHETREAAEAALEVYFCFGIICESEAPRIARHGKRWAVLFRGV